MKRLIIVFILILLAFTSARAAELRGVWAAQSKSDTTVQLNLSREHNQHGETMQLSSLSGLTNAQIGAISETPVHFRLDREAGVVAFDGSFKMRDGVGHFVFTPNPSYVTGLHALGISDDDLTSGGKDGDEMLFELALMDVSTSFIKEMQGAGYREPLQRYIEMRIFHVNGELVRELRALGYREIPIQKLIEMQIHHATPQFIRALAAAGYSDLPVKVLIDFRIFRITPELVGEYRALGYDKIASQQLVNMSIHRVTPGFIREMKDAGYSNVPVDKLIELRIHGIDGNYVKRMQSVR